jgi:hypothetical protein
LFLSINIPGQAAGNFQVSNQLQEELLEDAHDLLDSHQYIFPFGSYTYANGFRSEIFLTLKNTLMIASSGERIPPNHANEQLVPPPNMPMNW